MEGDRLKVDALAVDPLARLGGNEYATLEKLFCRSSKIKNKESSSWIALLPQKFKLALITKPNH